MGQFLKAGNPQSYKIDTASTFANGSLVRWDTGTRLMKPLAASANFAAFLGIAEFQYPQSSPIDNSGGNVSGLSNMGLVRREGVFPMLTTAAETYSHGDAVKRGANDLTIALDGGANEIIGYVNLPDGSQVVGATGVTVNIELKSNFGSQTILSA